jgi:hypothetical protein
MGANGTTPGLRSIRIHARNSRSAAVGFPSYSRTQVEAALAVAAISPSTTKLENVRFQPPALRGYHADLKRQAISRRRGAVLAAHYVGKAVPRHQNPHKSIRLDGPSISR